MRPDTLGMTDFRCDVATVVERLGFSLILWGWAVVAFAAAGMDGRYSGQFQGQPALATLSVQQSAVRGTLDVGGYVYRVEASRRGDGAEGRMLDQEGMAVPVNLTLKGQDLRMRVYVQGALAAPVEIVLVRDARAGGRASAPPAPAGQIDPMLVGQWVRSQSYTSGDFSAASETRVTLFANGTYQFGPGRVVGGGRSGSFDVGGGASGAGGRWRTENRILYTQEAGSGWTPYARYYVEGNSLMLTFGDGSREIWSRR